MADPREAWIAGRGRRSIEDARRRAAANTPEVMMSQTPEWYQNRENLSRSKDVLGNIPAVTTDQDESRNMYQMLMNQMKGGDRGARLVDKSGTTYNPFPEAGFGREFYKEQFPIASGLGSLMEAAENFMPGVGMAKRILSREREPLPRDPRFKPTYRSAYWEPSIFDLTGDYDVDTGYEWDEDIVEDEPLDYDWTDLWGIDELEDEGVTDDSIYEDIEEVIEEPDQEDIFNQTYEFVEDRGDDPDLPTAWEHFIKMKDHLGWEDERMIEHLIKEGVLRKKEHEMSREDSDSILYQTDNPLSFDEEYDFEEYVPR